MTQPIMPLTRKGSTLGALLLIAGCCIGAGMLGIPVVSATAGFLPATVAMFLCYLFMATTGLLLLEATLWFDRKVNVISIFTHALGRTGKIGSIVLFLFLFYCLLMAYTAGGGELIAAFLTTVLQHPVSPLIGSLLCTAMVGVVIYIGTHWVDHLNRLFMIGLVLSYILLVAIGAFFVNPEALLQRHWTAALTTIPIMLISFGYHNLIPSLSHYLHRNVKKLRLAIILGSLIPFVIYLVWQIVILGILPSEHDAAFKQNVGKSEMVTELLANSSGVPSVILLSQYFAFFAIATSFITCALSVVDFLADGMNVHTPSRSMRLALCSLVLIPPLCIALYNPHIFLVALGYAGGIATVILFGLFPALVVWRGRYHMKLAKSELVPGGKPVLVVVILLSLLFLALEIAQQLYR